MYKRFGKYEIISLIGQGGMGKVYKAFDTELKRTVALKIVLSRDLQFLQRFIVEMRTVAKLNHPNIIKIFQTGTENGIHFFTMEYIEGCDLADFLKNHSLDYKAKAVILSKVAFALHHCHTMGVVHRDLKPSNIMIRNNNAQPVLMDFGLAKDQEKISALTKTGELLGTPFYMSPEQILGRNKLVDHRSDIFALGVMMYEMLVGQIPYRATSMSALLVEVTEKKILPCCKLDESIPRDISRICEKAMHRNIQVRYQSAHEFAVDLRNYSRNKKVKVNLGSSLKVYTQMIIVVLIALIGFVVYKKTTRRDALIHTKEIVHVQDDFQEGKYLYQQKLYEASYQKLQKALRIVKSTDRHLVYEYLMCVCVEMGNYSAAQKFFEKIPKEHRDKQSLYLAQAKMMYEKRRYEDCDRFLKKITEDSLPETLLYRGLVNFHTGNYKRAIDFFRRCTQQKTSSLFAANARYVLGKAYFFSGNSTAAIAAFEESLPLLERRETYVYIARCYVKQQQYEKAKQILEKGWKLGGQNGEYLTLYAQILEKQKHMVLARETYIQALRSEVANVYALEGVIRTYLHKVSLRDTNIKYLFVYFNALTDKSSLKANIFFPYYESLVKKYAAYHFERLHLQKNTQSPLLLLKKLASQNKAIYNTAMKGLIALRYQKDIEKNIEAALSDFRDNPRVYRLVENVLRLIRKKKKQEQKYITFYYLAKCELGDVASYSPLHDFVEDEVLLQIFDDASVDDVLRYLCGKNLTRRLYFDVLEKGKTSDDYNKKLICHILLHYEKIQKYSLQAPGKSCSMFLAAKIAGICPYPYNVKLLKNPHLIVRVNTAISLLKDEGARLSRVDKEACIQAIVDCLQHDDAQYRRHVHFSFWRSKMSIVKENYVFHFITGCHDKDEDVIISALKNYNVLHREEKFMDAIRDNPEFIKRMEYLVEKKTDFTVRVLAGLWLQRCDPNNAVLHKVASDPDEIFFIRFIFTIGADATQFSLQGAMRMVQRVRSLTDSDDSLLRAAAYLLGAVLGSPVITKIDEETDSRLKASLLTSYRVKRLISFMGGQDMKKYLTAAKKYRNDADENVRTAAYAVAIALSSKEKREKLYRKILRGNDTEKKYGAAVGYYSLITRDLGEVSLAEGSKKFLSKEDEYTVFIENLVSSKKNPRKCRRYREWFSRALSLVEDDSLYYERSLLYNDDESSAALEDLQKAFAIAPKNRYLFTQAKILSSINPIKAREILQKIDYSGCDLEDFAQAAKIGISIADYEYARNMIMKYAFLHQEWKQKALIHLLLHNIHKRQQQEFRAKKHMSYARRVNNQ
ncbi:protein kinase domain-containing protein [Candidatus Uabimicrobium amorphum]|uniref:Protein kinase n=1 Tax=Uabimicrobium amorphum TaxID=2596890 RepID=A0A5S9II05_UABAM|nr:protein kinase [Candidatus Uabimicrobium amorphum]BBM82189.1 protein kinase [Candidatus Uabimicrobium amorphum]